VSNQPPMSDPQDETTRLLEEWRSEVAEHGIWTSGHVIGAKMASVLEAARQEIATLNGDAITTREASMRWQQRAESAEGQVDALTRAQADWQPIETAPKDGDTVIVYAAHYVRSHGVPASWDRDPEDERGQCWRVADAIADRVKPTHWMPLPSPPGEKPAERARVDALTAALEPAFVLLEGLRLGVEWELAPPIRAEIARVAELLAVLLDERGSR
jgi:hypothetical protein